MKRLKGLTFGILLMPFDWDWGTEVDATGARLHLGPLSVGVTVLPATADEGRSAAPPPVPEHWARVVDGKHAWMVEAWRHYVGVGHGHNARLFFARAQGVEQLARNLGVALSRPCVHRLSMAAQRRRGKG